jgi:hypothetical protein
MIHLTTVPDQDRPCLGCTVCCTAVPVKELAKEGGVACKYAGSVKGRPGCTVYARRPKSCQDFECLWLAGWDALGGADATRPDRLGAMFTHTKGSSLGRVLTCFEAWPGAMESAARRVFVVGLAGDEPVLVVAADGSQYFIGTAVALAKVDVRLGEGA